MSNVVFHKEFIKKRTYYSMQLNLHFPPIHVHWRVPFMKITMHLHRTTSRGIRKVGINKIILILPPPRDTNQSSLYSALSTLTINGPTLSPVSLLCATCEASHRGNVPDNQQRQYTFLSPAVILSMVATLGESSSILLLIRCCSWRWAVVLCR